MDAPDLHSVLRQSSTERLLVSLLHVAVESAAAEEGQEVDWSALGDDLAMHAKGARQQRIVDPFFDSLLSDSFSDMRWREIFSGVAGTVDPHRRDVWLADACAHVSDDDQEDWPPVGGPRLRRLDALLDLAEAPFSAGDVQITSAGIAQDLAQAKLDWRHSAAAMAIGGASGAAAGFLFAPFLGTLGQKGAAWFIDQASSVDESSEQAMHLVLAAMTMTAFDGAAAAGVKKDAGAIHEALQRLALKASDDVARYRRRSPNLQSGDGAYLVRRSRVFRQAWVYVADMLQEHDPGSVTITLPNVVNYPLSEARSLLKTLGCEVQENPQERFAMNASNWLVTAQQPKPSSPLGKVILTIRKYGE